LTATVVLYVGRPSGAENPDNIYAAKAVTADFIATFKEFPPRQRAGTFGTDKVMEKLPASPSSG